MTALLLSEARRTLNRRVVWVLVALALVGIALLGLLTFTDSSGRSPGELGADGSHAALMRDWWLSGQGAGILTALALPLVLGAILGGASVAGAEWRNDTVTTVLTWEPRRLRLHTARMAAISGLAMLIAFALEALALAAFLPAVVANGSTTGTDLDWWWALLAAMARIAVACGAAALLAASLATVARGTSFALGAIFAWVAVVEPLLREWKPGASPHLLGENLTILITWAPLASAGIDRPGSLAALVLCLYLGTIAVAAASVFARSDVAGPT